MREMPTPDFLAPMLPTLIKEPFDSSDWIFEPKLDGYRAIAVIDATGKVRIWSRNHLPLEPKFPTVLEAGNRLNLRSTILDGEIVALDSDGSRAFNCSRNGRNDRPPPSFTMCSMFCGVTERTSLPSRFLNGVSG
jgi:bifunctional non-homologous end joining protein LigD